MLELRHIRKDYLVDKKPFPALHDINLTFPDKGFVAILGPSGCGKTTLLNIIGGLDHYTSGDLLIDGRSTKDFKDRDWDSYRNKRIGFVFQSYNLIPHFTVIQNVEISLTLNGAKKQERTAKAKAVLEKVGLGDILDKKPSQLSGGQMQRVAIARALVNDPEIILADEPTGALDSKTSVQVLDLIKEVGQERCVIMVTHNRELAKQYSDRIVEMKDGNVISDLSKVTASFKAYGAPTSFARFAPTPAASLSPVVHDNAQKAPESARVDQKKTSMSFWTALKSSFRNVLTKKGRTVLTAVACSFGIIGVALVLATRNGFTLYVDNVETDVAGSVPIVVAPTIYNYTSAYVNNDTPYPDTTDVHIYDDSSVAYITHRNKYDQTYFNYISKCLPNSGDKAHQGLASDIIYNRDGLDFHFLTNDGTKDSILRINQYKSAGSMSSLVSSATSLPTTVMHEIFADDKYDVIYGRAPKAADEMVLIVDKYNQVDLSTLKRVGILNSDTTSHGATIAFSDIVYDGDGDTAYKTYKCYRNSDFYQVQNNQPVTKDYAAWTLKKYDASDPTNKVALAPGTAAEMDFTKVATTKTISCYEGPASNEDCWNNDGVYNPITTKIVGVLRPAPDSYISLMPSSIGYLSSLKDIMAKDSEAGQPGAALAALQKQNYFIPRLYKEDGSTASDDGIALLQANTTDMIKVLSGKTSDLSTTTILGAFNGVYRFYLAYDYIYPYTSVSYYLAMCHATGTSFDTSTVPQPDDYTGWLALLGSPDFYNEGLLNCLAYYSSYAVVSSVLIFPASLTTKNKLRAYLDAYNDNISNPDDQIVYTDVMNTFTSSLGTMIDVISAVLIVFASISLVVSSVMTAIITYVSVIERTKEIGVLRACGARKKDVGRLFEAECIITGFVAGVIGIAFTYIACIPINMTLDHLYPKNNLSSIAQLNPWHGLLLLALSIVLAFVSGFIPSRIAAKKDPVECLRSE
jgi:putative ABC transport system permease protein